MFTGTAVYVGLALDAWWATVFGAAPFEPSAYSQVVSGAPSPLPSPAL